MRGEILIDNFTLQGAYGFLFKGRQGQMYRNCVSNLLEAIVIYDKVIIPSGIVAKNFAVSEIANAFKDVIVEKSPYIHYQHRPEQILFKQLLPISLDNLTYDQGDAYQVVLKYVSRLIGSSPFDDFMDEQDDLLQIEGTGWTDRRYHSFLDFQGRQIYYALYCLILARRLGINYVPNPTRVPLMSHPNFDHLLLGQSTRRKVIEDVQKIRSTHAQQVNELFNQRLLDVDMPIILSYIQRRSRNDNEHIINTALKVRDSAAAKAYRKWAAKIEQAIESDNVAFLSSQLTELKEHAKLWAESLGSNSTKKVNFSIYWFSTEFDFPKPDLLWKKHIVFLHKLLK